MTTPRLDLALPPTISRGYLVRHRICPLRLDQIGGLIVAVTATASPEAVAEISAHFSATATTELVGEDLLEQLIERQQAALDRTFELERIPEDDERTADVRELANQPPVIRYVNLLLREAHDAAASDVHLEASRNGLIARFRLDGVLIPAPEPPRQLHHAVISRIKTLAELDIAERRRPQDGRIRVRMTDRELDLRVATIPTVHGESVVLRLLDRGGRPEGLDALGLPADMLSKLSGLVARPHGMLLVTGPTGSGKTTTLYAALQHRDATREKIITVEDPVEYELPAITQVPVSRSSGVTFATALRAILRQDPDVVMIGEMRDAETAEIAVQAAMTGHLVLSTLHTNDAISAIPRLLDLGIPEYLIGGTLEGVVAQRLVRRTCARCAEPRVLDSTVMARLTDRAVRSGHETHGRGCSHCRQTGFKGRIGIFELLRFSDDLKRAISQRRSAQELRAIALDEGMYEMREHGSFLVEAGETTLDEVLRVIEE